MTTEPRTGLYQRALRTQGVGRLLMVGGAIAMAGIGWGYGFVAWYDQDRSLGARLALLAFLALFIGVAVPAWLLLTRIDVTVDDDELTVAFWPFRAKVVPRAEILGAALVTVDPQRDFGGWGIKGTAEKRLYGLAGRDGVRVVYGDTGAELIILMDDGQPLVDLLDVPPASAVGEA